MSKKINLLGEVDNFFLALKDRLDRAGALFTPDSEEADITVTALLTQLHILIQ